MSRILVYVSGKYSGEIENNIAIARSVSVELWNAGFAVLCPHLNTAHFEKDCKAQYDDYIAGDLRMIEGCDAILMLPDWENSVGAKLEYEHAKKYSKYVVYLKDLSDIAYAIEELKVVEIKSLLHKDKKPVAIEAIEIVDGARKNNYGSPIDNHTRTADLWSVYLGAKVTPEQVCYLNILQKVSRSMQLDKRDNVVDIIGYSINIEKIKQSKEETW